MKKTFEKFKEVALIIVFFSEKMDTGEIEEIINDHFELYKGMNFDNPVEFYQFHLAEVTRDTHDFWLDQRGVMIMYLHSRTY